MKKTSQRVRLRVLRCVRDDDGHGGMRTLWVYAEERWGALRCEERFFPSNETIKGVSAQAQSKSKPLYSLRIRHAVRAQPFERFVWNHKMFCVLGEKSLLAQNGWDHLWAVYIGEDDHGAS